jgi:hydrogenase nickel incorporation protein HypA/HybF
MHELAITESILNQSIAEARKQSATAINVIKLKIGEGQSLVPECMQFYFETIRKGTLAAKAVLEIETVPVKVVCPKCRAEIKDLNPTCKCQAGAEIVSGQDLSIEYIDIETGPEEKIQHEDTKIQRKKHRNT